MADIFNAEEEMEASAAYDTIRMFNVEQRTSDDEELDDFAVLRWEDGWANTARSERVADFSAICLLWARYIIDEEGPRVID